MYLISLISVMGPTEPGVWGRRDLISVVLMGPTEPVQDFLVWCGWTGVVS